MKKLRIFLADDHAVVREGLKRLVNAEPDMEVVGEAEDGRDAVEEAAKSVPDVLLMDVSMTAMGGAEATKTLKLTAPSVKVVALTVHEDRAYLQELLEAGAMGYVLKRAACVELISAIRTVAGGALFVDPRLVTNLISTLIPPRPAELTPIQRLSERELSVLRLIATGYSNKEIAAQLNVSVKTTETYKSRSMQKLGLYSRVDVVRMAQEQGWFDEGTNARGDLRATAAEAHARSAESKGR